MESREKAKMKVAVNRSRIPTFLFVVLVIMVCVLTYNYWKTSSSNQQLLLKLRLAQGEQIITDRKRYALEDKIANMESENRLLEDDLVNDRAIKERALTLTSDLKVELQTVREKLNIAVENEVRTKREIIERSTFVNLKNCEKLWTGVFSIQPTLTLRTPRFYPADTPIIRTAAINPPQQ